MDGFRDYNKAADAVRETYKMGRLHQTYDFALERIAEYEARSKVQMKVWDAMALLENFIDSSDPDISIPNLYHLFQTAEAMRADNQPEWMQVIGLIHDLGKILYVWGSDETGTSVSNQWAIVGDTFVTGCKIPDSIVYAEFNSLNPDMCDPVRSEPYGVYNPNQGLMSCVCSWGHDEYMYRVLRSNTVDLPPEALYIVRFHSLYVHHREGGYTHLMDEFDHKMLDQLKLFNSYDLYTKMDMDKAELPAYYARVKPYYEQLVSKYLGDMLWF
jgi:inositol oxygenase